MKICNGEHVVFISAYAPTLAIMEEKNEFYEAFEKLLGLIKRKYKIVLLNDY